MDKIEVRYKKGKPYYEISLDGGKTEEINLSKLSKQELEHMIDIAPSAENYEMCLHLDQYLSKLRIDNYLANRKK